MTAVTVPTGAAWLLDAWSAAAAVPPAARGAAVLASAAPEPGWDAVLDLPLGTAAALAAQLCASVFGDVVDTELRCDGCGTRLEVAVPLHALPAPADQGPMVVAGALRVRSPTTRDLLAVRDAGDPARALLARCVRHADGAAFDPDGADPAILAGLDAAAESLAGSAATVLRTRCPECAAELSAAVDVAALLWERVATAAAALLAEVAELAMAFGWTEDAVLALPAGRRAAYLRLVRGER